MKAGLPAQLKPHYAWKDLVDDGIIIAGSPKTVRERLREAMNTLNCGHLITGIHMGSMPPELVRQSTELLAREVIPDLREMWSEWDDKWSPHPLDETERAEPASIDFTRNELKANGAPSSRPTAEGRAAK
jgi:hypothetical protein